MPERHVSSSAVDMAAPHSSSPRSTTVPPPSERIAVVVNGNAKNVTEQVIQTLDQILLGGDLFVSRRIEEAVQIACTIAQRGYGTVLTGGGDGTFTVMVSEVIKACRDLGRTPPRFGLLRLGTGNSLAWVVGAAKAKGRGLAADIQRLREQAGSRAMRFIEADGQVSPFCGYGIDAVVLQDKEAAKAWMLKVPVLRRFTTGELIYVVSTFTRSIPSYVFRATPHCRVVNEGSPAYRIGHNGRIVGTPVPKGDVLFEGKAKMAAVSTIPYYGFGFRMFPHAGERDDRMALRVTNISVPSFIANFPSIWRGEYQDTRVVSDFLVDDVTIEMDPPTPFQIGGDFQGVRDKMRLSLSKQPIQLVDYYAPPRGR